MIVLIEMKSVLFNCSCFIAGRELLGHMNTVDESIFRTKAKTFCELHTFLNNHADKANRQNRKCDILGLKVLPGHFRLNLCDQDGPSLDRETQTC